MKRVKAGYILQTLVFLQKNDGYLSKNAIAEANRREVERYFQTLDRSHIRYQLVSQEEQEDGTILIRIRKQYNDKVDVSEYFQ
jgi:hypothetical protein